MTLSIVEKREFNLSGASANDHHIGDPGPPLGIDTQTGRIVAVSLSDRLPEIRVWFPLFGQANPNYLDRSNEAAFTLDPIRHRQLVNCLP
jgi:hypothetical protein